MNLNEVLKLANDLVAKTGKGLTDVQEGILRGTWEDKDYNEIAEEIKRSEDRVREVGMELWQLLSQNLGKKVRKSNFRSTMERLQVPLVSNVVQENVQIGGVNFCGETWHSQNIPTSHPPHQETSNSKQTPTQHQDLSEMPELRAFCDRTAELQTLQTWILQERCRLIAIAGMSGIGKTALAVQLIHDLKDEFEYVVWRNLETSPTFGEFQADLIEIFYKPTETDIAATNSRPAAPLKYLQKHRSLIVLDDVHNLFSSGQLAGEYKPGYEEYGSLFKQIQDLSHKSCFLLIGWEQPREVAQRKSKNTPIRTLTLTGLDTEASREILRDKGLTDEREWDALIDRYQGNPLWLKSVATLIEALGDCVTEVLQNDTILLPSDLKDVLQQQFNRLSEIEKQVMRALARETGPVTLAKLLENGGMPFSDLLDALQSLSLRCLMEKQENFYTLSPVLRQYVKGL